MSGGGPVHLTDHVLRDIQVDALAAALDPATAAGRRHLVEQLSAPTTDQSVLRARQDSIRAHRATLRDAAARTTILAARDVLRETEADVATVAEAASDSRHAEYYTQILWDPKTVLAPLNRYGWIVEALVLFRTILLPAMSVFLPLFIFLAPIVFYLVVLRKPLSLSEYFSMLSVSLKKAMPSMLGKPRFVGRGGVLEAGEQMAHIGVSLAVFVGSVWSQISSARAMRRVVSDMRRRAESVRRMATALQTIAAACGNRAGTAAPAWCAGGSLELFGNAWNNPTAVRELLAEAGRIDAELSLALARRTCFVEYTDISGAPALTLDRLWHPGVPRELRVYNSVSLGTDGRSPHALLTGPNRGGKSTLLKSLGAAVLMGHTVGIAFARRARMPIFSTIATALSPTDIIGEMSLFESEIEFARSVQSLTAAGPMFLMMDEIFHGTNAHDGVEAAQVFLDDIYARRDPIVSIVSTHYMELPERYGKTQAQMLCMEASVDPADSDQLVYTYRLRRGVNRFSSVREILRERGLLAKKSSAPAGKE